MTAIRQHLTSEHVAVAQANYQVVPFIHPDSIDAGSSSLLKTIIETYVYQSGLESDYSESNDYEEDLSESKYSEEERKAIAAMVKLHAADLIENMEEMKI